MLFHRRVTPSILIGVLNDLPALIYTPGYMSEITWNLVVVLGTPNEQILLQASERRFYFINALFVRFTEGFFVKAEKSGCVWIR